MDSVIYVKGNSREREECFNLFRPLFSTISLVHRYGVLKDGRTIRFVQNTRGIHNVKDYNTLKEILLEWLCRYQKVKLHKYEELLNELKMWIRANNEFYPECKPFEAVIKKIEELEVPINEW